MIEPQITVYCDGCCEPNPGVGGWGFAAFRGATEVHAECGGFPDTTNNVMEMTAAISALRWIAGNVDGPARLLSDSQYVTKGCNIWRHNWKERGWRRGNARFSAEVKNRDLWETLDLILNQLPRVRIEWVRGHAGIPGNERADALAALGRQQILFQQKGRAA